MTRDEAVNLIEAHEHVVRRWAGAHHDKIEEAMHEQIASREPIIAALTRPAPQHLQLASKNIQGIARRELIEKRAHQMLRDFVDSVVAWSSSTEREKILAEAKMLGHHSVVLQAILGVRNANFEDLMIDYGEAFHQYETHMSEHTEARLGVTERALLTELAAIRARGGE